MSEKIDSTDLLDVSWRGRRALRKGKIKGAEEVVMRALLAYKEVHGTMPTSEELKAFLREHGFKIK